MTHPDPAATVNGNGISTPDVLSIEVRDANILDNDIAATRDAQSLPFTRGHCSSAILKINVITNSTHIPPALPFPNKVLFDPTVIPDTPAFL
jgi:hypothetical protein